MNEDTISIERVIALLTDLLKTKFWGKIIITLKNGNIVYMKKEESLK